MATSDPIAEIIGDYRTFAARQRDRLIARGIDIAPYALSHLAVRVPDWDVYVHQRTLLERHATANLENVVPRPRAAPVFRNDPEAVRLDLAGADEFSVACQSLPRTDPQAHGQGVMR